MPAVHTRIAPTPSGYLHKGNAYNFLLAQQLVKENGGTLRLRIDDSDTVRSKPEYLQDIFDCLHWLRIEWHKGPQTVKEQLENYNQQLRLPRYHQLIEELIATNKVYACNCSRKEILTHHNGHYPGTCRHKNTRLHQPDMALRLLVPEGTTIHIKDKLKGDVHIDISQTLGDFVIRRRDGLPAFHTVSLVDDTDFGVNTVVRGEDLLESTAAQLYMARLLGLDTFNQIQFYHHPLFRDEQGNKLSKSAGSLSLKWMRENGIQAKDIFA